MPQEARPLSLDPSLEHKTTKPDQNATKPLCGTFLAPGTDHRVEADGVAKPSHLHARKPWLRELKG